MSYKRADDILPEDVLETLQRYVSGELLYVPSRKECRRKWGSATCANENLRLRNEQIFEQYKKGISTKELAGSGGGSSYLYRRFGREPYEKCPPYETGRAGVCQRR